MAGAKTLIVPMAVEYVSEIIVEIVPVCLDDKGPFPFALDTGASNSLVSFYLAHLLGLAFTSPNEVRGAACATRAYWVSPASWSVGAVSVAPEQLNTAYVAGFDGPGEIDGLLGSDVLSSFGSVVVDYAGARLLLSVK